MEKLKKAAVRTAAALIAIMLILLCAFAVVRQVGKNSLSEDITLYSEVWGTEDETAEKSMKYKRVFYEGTEYGYRDDTINILFLGIDKDDVMASRSAFGNSVGQSDAIFLASVDLSDNCVRVIAIPRDTMVQLKMYDGDGNYIGTDMGQLTLQYAYADGMEKSASLVASQVSALLNEIPINGYIAVNLTALTAINDAVGGVDVTMDDDYTELNEAFVNGETVHLEGNLAKAYVRGRDITEQGSAYTRIHRQKIYLSAFLEQAKQAVKENPLLPFTIMDTLSEHLETDISTAEMMYLVTEALGVSLSDEDMYTLSGELSKGTLYEEYYLNEEDVLELTIALFYEEI